jgi:hypothetical protein
MLSISELFKVKSFELPAFDTLTVRFEAGLKQDLQDRRIIFRILQTEHLYF